MAEISIHDDNKVAASMLDAVYICGTQAQLWCSWSQQDTVFSVDCLQLLGYIECSIGTAVIDDDYLIVDFTGISKYPGLNW